MVGSSANPKLERSRSVSSDAGSMHEPKLMKTDGQVRSHNQVDTYATSASEC